MYNDPSGHFLGLIGACIDTAIYSVYQNFDTIQVIGIASGLMNGIVNEYLDGEDSFGEAFFKGYLVGIGMGIIYFGACAIAALYELECLMHDFFGFELYQEAAKKIVMAICAYATGNKKQAVVNIASAVLCLLGSYCELNMSGIITVKGPKGTVDIATNYKLLRNTSADDVNAIFKQTMGYEPPYKPGTMVSEIELTENATFVRVYDKINSKMEGGWIMKAEDIAGLTPQEIQNKFSLQTTPEYICDVVLEPGTKLRAGEANPLFGHEGGGQQFDLLLNGKKVGTFVKERRIGQ